MTERSTAMTQDRTSAKIERLARELKASKIAAVLRKVRVGPIGAARLSDKSWALACQAAKVRPASEKTQALVIEMLKKRGIRK